MAALQAENSRQLKELQQLAAAAADLQAAKDTEPSSPATKEITPPKPWEAAAHAAPMLRRVQKELPPKTHAKVFEVLSGIDREGSGWLEPREFQFGLKMAGCVSFDPEQVEALVRELQDSEKGAEGPSEHAGHVSINQFMIALDSGGASATPQRRRQRRRDDLDGEQQEEDVEEEEEEPAVADRALRSLLDYTSHSKTTVKMFLQRYTEGGAGELTVGQFQSALRSAGERCSAEQVKQLMGELLVLCGSCSAKAAAHGRLAASLDRISVGRVLDGVKQWRRHQALSNSVMATPSQSARKSGWRTRSTPGGTPSSAARRGTLSAACTCRNLGLWLHRLRFFVPAGGVGSSSKLRLQQVRFNPILI